MYPFTDAMAGRMDKIFAKTPTYNIVPSRLIDMLTRSARFYHPDRLFLSLPHDMEELLLLPIWPPHNDRTGNVRAISIIQCPKIDNNHIPPLDPLARGESVRLRSASARGNNYAKGGTRVKEL
jgi:hypothetical protein